MTSQGKRIFRINGQVVDPQRRGIAGLRVEAWDNDLIFDDLVGAAVTDGQGAFHLEFDQSFFEETLLDRYPDLYFKIFHRAQLLKSTQNAILWNVQAGDTTITIELDLPMIGEPTPSPKPTEPAPFIVQGQIRREQDKSPLAGITVKAFDKDLRQETSLGEAQTDAAGHYAIRYTADRFSRADKKRADLLVRAYGRQGALLGETPEILFDAQPCETVDLLVSPPPPLAEYDELLAVLAPILRDLPPAELTEQDLAFLLKELADEAVVDERRLQILAQSARLARETTLPTECFYGIARALPLEPPLTLDAFLTRTAAALRQALDRALDDHLVPAGLHAAVDGYLARFDALRVERGQLVRRELTGRLLDKATDNPLAGYTVHALDLDAGETPKDLGYAITTAQGQFGFAYTVAPKTPSEQGGEAAAGRRFRLHVADPQGKEIHQAELQAPPAPAEPLAIRVSIPEVPERGAVPLQALKTTLNLQIPKKLQKFLKDRHLETLADIRREGGIVHLKEDLPVAVDDPVVRTLEAHAGLSTLSTDIAQNQALIDKGFTSLRAIADAPRSAFVKATAEPLGDASAARTYLEATTQVKILDNLITTALLDRANGFPESLEFSPPIGDLIVADEFPTRCVCKDCESAVSPGAYLADLLAYTLKHLKNGDDAIALGGLTQLFHQPFGELIPSCEAMAQRVRQVRICIEVLRRFIRASETTEEDRSALDRAEKAYRLKAYQSLLTHLGASHEEVRLARSADDATRQRLADRLGIAVQHLDGLLLDPAAPADRARALTEAALERVFGLVATQHGIADPLPDPLRQVAPSQLQNWRLDSLRRLWRDQDWPADAYGAETDQPLPVLDPDVVGLDDLRRPVAGQPVFELWQQRRRWVDKHLEEFRAKTQSVVIDGATVKAPDLAAMFKRMTQPIDPGGESAWNGADPATPKPAEFTKLLQALTQGADAKAVAEATTAIRTRLKLAVDSFTRLLEIREKDRLAGAHPDAEPVSGDEWEEVYSILAQAQKVALFPSWREGEQTVAQQLDHTLFGPEEFWISLREPVEGNWPPLPVNQPGAVRSPLIDPERVKLEELPDSTVGQKAIQLWHARREQLATMTQRLKTAREQQGFTAMVDIAFGDPPAGQSWDHELASLDKGLRSDGPQAAERAKTTLQDTLHLTVEQFTRLMAIKTKSNPTEPQWSEVYAILTTAQKIRQCFGSWKVGERQLVPDAAQDLLYCYALKARRPRWRAAAETRQTWQQALRARGAAPIIDPDLIAVGDLAHSYSGQAYALWKARANWVQKQLKALAKSPRNLAGLATAVQNALDLPGMDLDALKALDEERQRGASITGRLDQVGLSYSACAYLLRVSALLERQEPVLAAEWEAVYSILAQAQKRRAFADWRQQEQKLHITLGPDFFKIPEPAPLQFPPPEPEPLPEWRATWRERRDWQDKLQSRIDQEQTVLASLREMVGATEEAVLPLLRNILLEEKHFYGSNLDEKAKFATDHLLIDAKAGGCQLTTRITQATETVQLLLWSVRTGQLRDTHPQLALDAENFDEEWQWIGSYESWRSAMFVFLYPENILLPSLRGWQTPGFKTLVEKLRGKSVTPEAVSQAAKEYTEYFWDVCNLQLAASCQTETSEIVNEKQVIDRTLIHIFALGSNTVYWSTRQPGSNNQTFWEPIPALQNAVEVIGAVPYNTSISKRFIFLFVRIAEGNKQKLVFTCYDLKKASVANKDRWSTPETLALPQEESQQPTEFQSVVKQTTDEDRPPHLAIRLPNGAIYERKLNVEGNAWAEIAGDWEPVVGSMRGHFFEHLCSMVEINADQLCLVTSDRYGRLWYRLFGELDDLMWRELVPNGYGAYYRGSIFYGNQSDNKKLFFFYGYGEKFPNYYFRTYYVSIDSSAAKMGVSYDILTIRKLDEQLIKIWGIGFSLIQRDGKPFIWMLEDFERKTSQTHDIPQRLEAQKELVSSEINALAQEIENNIRWKQWKRADQIIRKFTGGISLMAGVKILLFDHISFFKFPNRNGEELTIYLSSISSISRIVPMSGLFLLNEPKHIICEVEHEDSEIKKENYYCTIQLNYKIPYQPWFAVGQIDNVIARLSPIGPVGTFGVELSHWDLQLKRSSIHNYFHLNTNIGFTFNPNLIYFEECYYFAPIYIALELQRKGYYTDALDWFRTIYDYCEAVVENRKIYYGLEQEESLGETSERSADWLLDPLNPHSIAQNRRNSYTRFTLCSIIHCLLAYADSEFSRDTAESVPRARTLYMTALELLELPELKQELASCQKMISDLDVQVDNSVQKNDVNEIITELSTLRDQKLLRQTLMTIKEVFYTDDLPWEERVAKARVVIDEAKAHQPAPRDLANVLADRAVAANETYKALLARGAITRRISPVPVIVTGISSVLLNENQNKEITIFAPFVGYEFCIPPNPVIKALRLHAELNLYKIRTCRNIAGLKRQLEPYAAPTDTVSGLLQIGATVRLLLPQIARPLPSPYRYVVLIERAKQLVQLAAQIEASMLSALENRDMEAYNRLKAQQDMRLTHAGVTLQSLRVREAEGSVTLAQLQQERAQIQVNHYADLLANPISDLEQEALNLLQQTASYYASAANSSSQARLFGAISGMISGGYGGVTAGAALGTLLAPGIGTILGGFAGGVLGAFSSGQSAAESARSSYFTSRAAESSTRSTIASTRASYERRAQEWAFQQTLAVQDVVIGSQQITLARDHVRVVGQEHLIAEMQADHAEDTLNFLTTKFTSVELYDWMSGILEEVYRFFLQQATAMAKLAENQLAFERQETPPTYIRADYWEVSSEQGFGRSGEREPDRRGLTGSARLLQDVFQLDQYAFETNRRKLQLAKTLSLAWLDPYAFQRFRETGVLPFATPMELFDRDFPGHYLRLIKRVRTSVIALIPPVHGIHATLSTTSLSRVVIGPDVFQTVNVRRDPEYVALTSPSNATGLFELESEPGMLLPFEGLGVDTTWEFRLPKAANMFDFRTIADVLITIEYTALNSFDYRQQVIQQLDNTLSADRPFSLRSQFADQWYDLHNPDRTSTPMAVRFETRREDFPPNIDELKIRQVVLYFARLDGQEAFEIPVKHLRLTGQDGQGTVGGGATSIDGVISTRRGNAGSWMSMIGKAPVGQWELALPDSGEVRNRFEDEAIEDILLVITYSGRTPEWPA